MHSTSAGKRKEGRKGEREGEEWRRGKVGVGV